MTTPTSGVRGIGDIGAGLSGREPALIYDGSFSFPNVMDGFVIVLYSFRRLLIDLTFDHLNQLGPFTSIDCILKAPLLGLWPAWPRRLSEKTCRGR